MIIDFGIKHKGKQLEDVILSDPKYLVWMCEKGKVKLPKQVITECLHIISRNEVKQRKATPLSWEEQLKDNDRFARQYGGF